MMLNDSDFTITNESLPVILSLKLGHGPILGH